MKHFYIGTSLRVCLHCRIILEFYNDEVFKREAIKLSFRKSTNKKGPLSTGSRTSRVQNRQSLDNYENALASAHLLDSYARIRSSLAHHNAFTPDYSSLKHQDLGHDKMI